MDERNQITHHGGRIGEYTECGILITPDIKTEPGMGLVNCKKCLEQINYGRD